MADKLKLTEARTLHFFHHERGDLTRGNWEQMEPILRRDFPQVIDALDRLRSAERTLDAVVDQMLAQVEADPEADDT